MFPGITVFLHLDLPVEVERMNIFPQPISRRSVLSKCALAAMAGFFTTARSTAQKSPAAPSANLINHPRRQYSFIRGIPAYSAGVVARIGYEIVHVTFSRVQSLEVGFKAISDHLTALNLPKYALCALELRLPLALSSEGFRTFNTRYLEALRSWSILLDVDVNPIARTNVAPVLFPPDEPGIHGFSYVGPSSVTEKTFIVAGGGELPDGSTNPVDIYRRGDTSPLAMLEKARFVVARMETRLRVMGVNWPNVTAINVYTAHELTEKLMTEVLHNTGNNAVTWNYARPPIKDLEFEMDLRGVKREFVL